MLYNLVDSIYPMLIYYVAGSVLYILLGTALGDTLVTALTALVMLPVVLWLYSRNKKMGKIRIKKAEYKAWTYILIVVGAVVISQAFTWIMNQAGVTQTFSNEAQESLMAGALVVQIAGFGLIAPVTEELIFRGLLYGRMKSFLKGYQAVLLSSAVFALYHGNMVQIIYAFPMGLILIYVYEKWGDLKAPIVFHMAANLVSVLINAFYKM